MGWNPVREESLWNLKHILVCVFTLFDKSQIYSVFINTIPIKLKKFIISFCAVCTQKKIINKVMVDNQMTTVHLY